MLMATDIHNAIHVPENVVDPDEMEEIKVSDLIAQEDITEVNGNGQTVVLVHKGQPIPAGLNVSDAGGGLVTAPVEMQEGNLVKDASDAVLVEMFFAVIEELKGRDLDEELRQVFAARLDALDDELDNVEPAELPVPEDVEPGETPGWPIDAVTGELLPLRPEQRTALAAKGISGTVNVDDVADLVEGEVSKETPGQMVTEATEAAIKLAEANSIDIGQVEGSGAGGRVLESDVQKAIKAKATED